ncbi:hypothetical protein EZJ55_12340 [Microcystis aeruginosa EAWAG127a]|uniref:Uncharacterized protein n=1 Tax=Microcystis aeruginosa EAWAG127a TaxID=2529855 RepID=A0A5J5LU57_MICAE|nr:hypothetical protein EZJ55_12340 [Microcystis aeruginosa EAWAG127a]
MISLTDIGSINLCVLCVFVVRSTPSLGGMYLRIHFTHQIQESRNCRESAGIFGKRDCQFSREISLLGFIGNCRIDLRVPAWNTVGVKE